MPPATERRISVVAAADVVGYSRLMGVDEDGTLATLKAHRAELVDPKTAEHGGRIVKTTGDGLLLEFSSALATVGCCLEVQTAMAVRNEGLPENGVMRFRVGINLGDIIIDGEDIHGDGVNIAARLESIAAPGGICLSDDVMRQVQGRLDVAFTDGGRREVKNIAAPVHVWHWSPDGAAGAFVGFDENDERPSIAVLPFDNMSRDSELEYFGDDIADDIITILSKVSGMRVIARNSTFA